MYKILSIISFISLTITYCLQFGKIKQHNVSVPSTLKAIPVAVMLALSPMATQAQTHKPLTAKEAFKLAESGQVIKTYEIENASGLYGNCEIKFIDTDKNPQTAELAELVFDKTDWINGSLSAYAKIYPEVLVEDKYGFWVQGNGNRHLYYRPEKIHEREDTTKIQVPITERFFNTLVGVYNGELPVIRDKSRAYGICF